MKKIGLLLITLCSSSFAMSTADLTQPYYKCNGTLITTQTTINQLMSNCKNAKLVERTEVVSGRNANRIPGGGADMTSDNSTDNEDSMDKVKFYTDRNSYMICYFKNSNLAKCKVSPPKKQVQSKQSSSTATGVTSNIQQTNQSESR